MSSLCNLGMTEAQVRWAQICQRQPMPSTTESCDRDDDSLQGHRVQASQQVDRDTRREKGSSGHHISLSESFDSHLMAVPKDRQLGSRRSRNVSASQRAYEQRKRNSLTSGRGLNPNLPTRANTGDSEACLFEAHKSVALHTTSAPRITSVATDLNASFEYQVWGRSSVPKRTVAVHHPVPLTSAPLDRSASWLRHLPTKPKRASSGTLTAALSHAIHPTRNDNWRAPNNLVGHRVSLEEQRSVARGAQTTRPTHESQTLVPTVTYDSDDNIETCNESSIAKDGEDACTTLLLNWESSFTLDLASPVSTVGSVLVPPEINATQRTVYPSREGNSIVTPTSQVSIAIGSLEEERNRQVTTTHNRPTNDGNTLNTPETRVQTTMHRCTQEKTERDAWVPSHTPRGQRTWVPPHHRHGNVAKRSKDVRPRTDWEAPARLLADLDVRWEKRLMR